MHALNSLVFFLRYPLSDLFNVFIQTAQYEGFYIKTNKLLALKNIQYFMKNRNKPVIIHSEQYNLQFSKDSNSLFHLNHGPDPKFFYQETVSAIGPMEAVSCKQ